MEAESCHTGSKLVYEFNGQLHTAKAGFLFAVQMQFAQRLVRAIERVLVLS